MLINSVLEVEKKAQKVPKHVKVRFMHFNGKQTSLIEHEYAQLINTINLFLVTMKKLPK
jgi:hypothetical protein